MELEAQKREILGKKVRFLRREGLLPANLYGPGIASVPLVVDSAGFRNILLEGGRRGLLTLKVSGDSAAQQVMIREIQRDPLSRAILHVDFHRVSMTDKLEVEVPLALVGEAPAVSEFGATFIQESDTIAVECLPVDIPHSIEVNLSALKEPGDILYASDLIMPAKVTLISDLHKVIVRAEVPRVEEEVVEVEAREVEVVGRAEREEAEGEEAE